MKIRKAETAKSMLIAAVMLLMVSAVSYAGQAEQDSKTTSKDVKRESKEALQAIKSYSFEQRDKAVKEGFIEGYDSVASAFDKAQKEFDSDGKK